MELTSKYYSIIVGLLEKIVKEEKDSLRRASQLLANSIESNKIIHVIGAGHSAMLGEELFYRAGGLAVVNPIIDNDITVGHGALKSTLLENVEGYAEVLLESARVVEGDTVIIVSTSGVNTFPIEAALKAKDMGASTIAITSKKYSSQLEPRNPWGKHLYEVVDVAIDNKVPRGDAVLELPGLNMKVAPVSTILNSFIASLLVAYTVNILLSKGIKPPIWLSSHLPEAREHNKELFEKYSHRIKLL